jgi:hypothetical protein
VAVILVAVHAALRIFLHVSALDEVAVVVRVLFALAVAAAVVRLILGVVHAGLARRGLRVTRIPGPRELGRLRKQHQTVRTDFLEMGKRPRGYGARRDDERERDECSFDHESRFSNPLSMRRYAIEATESLNGLA